MFARIFFAYDIYMQRIILHIDFDSFFASVEQHDYPRLLGIPIGVTAANSRTAIIAASVEAKRLGVKGGSSSKDAFQVCPNLLLVPAHFPRYFEISKKFLQICRLYSPYIEVFSIDELFMDVTQTVKLFGSVESLVAKLKAQIQKEIGEHITVSVGVSYNKLLAKLASGMNKPNGMFVITKENLEHVYETTALTDICGIGPRIEGRLHMLGIDTLFKLRQVSFEQLRAEFGAHEAKFLKNVAWAQDETEVVHFGHAPEVKSVGRNYCLPKNEYNQRVILQNIFELSEEIGIKLRRLNKKARTVGLSLRGTMSMHGRQTSTIYMDKGKELFEVCLLLYNKWQWGQGEQSGMVRQISVWVSGLVDDDKVQHSLFDGNYKNDKLTKTIDSINERFGNHTIRNGFLLYSDKLTTVPNGFLADKWDRIQLTKLY